MSTTHNLLFPFRSYSFHKLLQPHWNRYLCLMVCFVCLDVSPLDVEMRGCKWRAPKWDPDSKLPSVEGSSPLPAPSITQISRGHGGHCAPFLLAGRERGGSLRKAEGSCLTFAPCFPSCFLAAMDPRGHTSDKPSPQHLLFPSPFFFLSLATLVPFWPILQPLPVRSHQPGNVTSVPLLVFQVNPKQQHPALKEIITAQVTPRRAAWGHPSMELV